MPDPEQLPRLSNRSPQELHEMGLTPQQARVMDDLNRTAVFLTMRGLEKSVSVTLNMAKELVKGVEVSMAPALALVEALRDKGILGPEFKDLVSAKIKEIEAGMAVNSALGKGALADLEKALEDVRQEIRKFEEKNR